MRKQLTFCDAITQASPWNDICWTTAKIPYWWWFTTQIWEELLIGWKFVSPLSRSNSQIWVWHVITEIFRFSSDLISWGNQRWRCFLRLILAVVVESKRWQRQHRFIEAGSRCDLSDSGSSFKFFRPEWQFLLSMWWSWYGGNLD